MQDGNVGDVKKTLNALLEFDSLEPFLLVAIPLAVLQLEPLLRSLTIMALELARNNWIIDCLDGVLVAVTRVTYD